MSEALVDLLRQGRYDEAAGHPDARRGGGRRLVARLWDGDTAVGAGAAEVIGRLAATDRRRGEELVRRLMWALNDESATAAAAVLPALAAIADSAPEILAPHLGALLALLDDPALQSGLVSVLERAAVAAPELLAEHRESLATREDGLRETERARVGTLLARLTKEGG